MGIRAGGQGEVAVAQGEAEIRDQDAAVVADHDVVWFEVAVDQALLVGGHEAPARGLKHRQDLGSGGVHPLPPLAQGLALDELHGDEGGALELTDLVDLDDIRMGDAGHGLGLSEQAGVAVAIGEQQFDGDLSIEILVVGGVDHPHAASSHAVQEHIVIHAGELEVFQLVRRVRRQGRVAACIRGWCVHCAGSFYYARSRLVEVIWGLWLTRHSGPHERGTAAGTVPHVFDSTWSRVHFHLSFAWPFDLSERLW